MSTPHKNQKITFTFQSDSPLSESLLSSLAQFFKDTESVQLISIDQSETSKTPARTTVPEKQQKSGLQEILRIARRIHSEKLFSGLKTIHESLPLDITLNEIKYLRTLIPNSLLNTPDLLLDTVQQSNLSAAYISTLDKKLETAEALTEKAAVICSITQTLSRPIPLNPDYHSLHLARKIVRTYLDGEKLLSNPYIIDGALTSAFQEFYTQYMDRYQAEFKHYQDSINVLSLEYGDVNRTAIAIEKLIQIPQLDIPNIPPLLAEWKTFLLEFPSHRYRAEDVEKSLKDEGAYRNFSIGMKPPTHEWIDLKKRIKKAFQTQISRIQKASTQHIIQSQNSSAVDQFRHLLQLTHLEDLAKLIEQDSGDDICFSLHKLFLSPSFTS